MVDGKPLVSCIIIFFNSEAYLEEAIQSVFAQTHPHWELLLVDDGSSDGSTAIAQRYAHDFPGRVRYLEHPGRRNRGMSATRNLGLRHARGDYIAFLDADDLWLPAKLAEQVAILEREPRAAMVYGRTLIWHSWTGRPEDRARDHTIDLGVTPDKLVEPPALFLLMLANKTQSPTTCNALIRRRAVDDVGGFEEQFRGMYEDQAFFAKLQLKAPIYVAGACWAKYRQHGASCSARAEQSSDYYATRRPFLTWLANYLVAKGISTESLMWRALEQELWRADHPHWRRLMDLLIRVLGRVQAIRPALLRDLSALFVQRRGA
jgi:glycosyltransferase involved in cell wall biosynthesis